jgi:preprotein translocase subunit SecA
MIEDVAYDLVEGFVFDKTEIKEWDLKGLSSAIKGQFNMDLSLDKPVQENFSADQLGQYVFDAAQALYQKKEAMYGPEIIRHVERFIILQTVDTRWKEHLLNMDHLKEGIGLRGYAQQDPLRIYKKEGFDMFQDLMNRIKQEVVDILFKIQIASPTQVEEMKQEEQQDLTFSSHSDESAPKQPVRRSSEKISRNAPCPCGSGKKYKKCCGQ